MIAAALIGSIIYRFLPEEISLNDPAHIGNTAGNLANGGLFCEMNGKVYFSNSYENGSLYVMNNDETEIKKLNDLNVFSINVGGDYIYFGQGSSRFSGEGFGIFRTKPGLMRSKLNGKDMKTMLSFPITTATLAANEIIYQSGSQLFRMGTDGENDRQLSSININPSSYVNGTIYYANAGKDHFVYALDVASGYSSVVFEANTYNAIYEGGYIYYLDLGNNYRLCRYSIYDHTIEILTSDRVDFYNIGYGVIFYQKNSPTEPALVRMNLDGSDQEIIRPGNHNHINMTSRYVYFQDFGDEVRTYKTPLYGAPSVSIFRP